MSAAPLLIETQQPLPGLSIQQDVEWAIVNVVGSLPGPDQLSPEQRRGIIARYASVLEGNFIYWMTGAYLAVTSEEAREIITNNLLEEVRDCHPGMMRRFAIAANAVPTESDALAIYPELTQVRLFVGRLAAAPLLVTMAFFEGFIQRFMAFLADLSVRQGSNELEYTDVHGICDIAHTQGLFCALHAEMKLNPPVPGVDLFEGVRLLTALIHGILEPSRT